MFGDGPEATNFLRELYENTSGDPAKQVSMYDVGAALGMDKSDAGKVAEDLIGNGLVEVKTLSGGIGITAQGIETVQGTDGYAGATTATNLGSGTVIDEPVRQALEALLADLKIGIAQSTAAFASLEEMVMDLKTAEIQLLSPKPKTAILREVLRSLQTALAATGSANLSARLKQMVDQ